MENLTNHEKLYLIQLLATQEDETASAILHKVVDLPGLSPQKVKYLVSIGFQKTCVLRLVDDLESLVKKGECDETAVKELKAMYDQLNTPESYRLV